MILLLLELGLLPLTQFDTVWHRCMPCDRAEEQCIQAWPLDSTGTTDLEQWNEHSGTGQSFFSKHRTATERYHCETKKGFGGYWHIRHMAYIYSICSIIYIYTYLINIYIIGMIALIDCEILWVLQLWRMCAGHSGRLWHYQDWVCAWSLRCPIHAVNYKMIDRCHFSSFFM